MCSTALLVQTLQNICGTIGFYIINLLIYDRNANITLSQFDLWEKQEKLQIIGNQFSVEKKRNLTTHLVLLHYIVLVLLSYTLCILIKYNIVIWYRWYHMISGEELDDIRWYLGRNLMELKCTNPTLN